MQREENESDKSLGQKWTCGEMERDKLANFHREEEQCPNGNLMESGSSICSIHLCTSGAWHTPSMVFLVSP